ncbi:MULTISPECIES: LysR family transcriptional regulator [unclassified Sphingomonas]|uniref:LysR family transcriptional regulator n=1 Tax=unclassified Sphingomonas TaxID=196159 RepID=UPI0006FB5209|nr:MULTISPECIES: LysR family transcriptional regulator [unclassified Sphingomonas]KQX26287.1 LysR family transcriptional regulator [Sphingomonas sp. Root1294]KQY69357.1 LysR family transcriptional regulator [Sphingomonas sp. Root50]KRB89616.1 LysR family transcriptional regulator [Sphingomonas sp. Root720]
MQLRPLRYFTTLAREGHFGRAADACGVTQPTLSAGIAALEEQFGRRLVQRDRRYIGLTPEGQAMLPWAQQLVAVFDGMAHAMLAMDGPVQGEFRLGAIPAAMPAVGHVARALLALHPAMTLSVRSLTSREIERGLGGFDLDAGLTYLDHEPPADMLTAPLYAERYIFLARAGGGFDGRAAIGWAEAAATDLCLLHQGMQNRRILDARLAERGLAIHPRATADSYVALLAMVQAGGFATIMPDSYLALLPGLDWARILPFDDPAPASRIGVIVPNRSPVGPLAAAALAIARSISLPQGFGT